MTLSVKNRNSDELFAHGLRSSTTNRECAHMSRIGKKQRMTDDADEISNLHNMIALSVNTILKDGKRIVICDNNMSHVTLHSTAYS